MNCPVLFLSIPFLSISINGEKKQKGRKVGFEQDVLHIFHKVKYSNLVMNERRRKTYAMSIDVMAMCIDFDCVLFKKEREEYYEGNKDLAISILDVLDRVKLVLLKKVKDKLQRFGRRRSLTTNSW